MKKLIVGLLVMFMGVGLVYPAFGENGQFDFSLRKGENRKTLSPNIFMDPIVRKAYAVARRIPWVLDSIYCYCLCEENFGHKSLLSCYVDNHAAQ